MNSNDIHDSSSNSELINVSSSDMIIEIKGKSKLSNPTIALSGHEGGVLSVSFSPSGDHLASASMDGKICEFSAFLNIFLAC
jgi:WD40 repeat protein